MSTELDEAQGRIERLSRASIWAAVSYHINEQARDSGASLIYRKVRAPVYEQIWVAMRELVYQQLKELL